MDADTEAAAEKADAEATEAEDADTATDKADTTEEDTKTYNLNKLNSDLPTSL